MSSLPLTGVLTKKLLATLVASRCLDCSYQPLSSVPPPHQNTPSSPTPTPTLCHRQQTEIFIIPAS